MYVFTTYLQRLLAIMTLLNKETVSSNDLRKLSFQVERALKKLLWVSKVPLVRMERRFLNNRCFRIRKQADRLPQFAVVYRQLLLQ